MQIITGNNGKQIAILPQDTHISKWVKESGRLDHDQNMLPLLKPYIKEGDIVVDAGAYIGDHTIFYSKMVGPSGRVFAYEMNREAFDCLEYNCHYLDNVHCLHAGLGKSIYRAAIEVDGKNVGASHQTKGDEYVILPLDSSFIPAVNFIKIDCEGMEVEILQGGEKLIRKHMPVMLIEINEGALQRQGYAPKDVYELLKSWGYQYRNIYEQQGINQPQIDILCTKK